LLFSSSLNLRFLFSLL